MAIPLSDNIVDLFNQLLDDVIREQQPMEFTLPQLFERFEKLSIQNEIIADIDYKEFRKALFQSPVNEEMRKRGGEIIIKKNTGKVDESVYCLKLIVLRSSSKKSV